MTPADDNDKTTATGLGSTTGSPAAGSTSGTGTDFGGATGASGATSTTLGTSGMEPATPSVGATFDSSRADPAAGGMNATMPAGDAGGSQPASRVREQAMKLRGQATEKARGAAEQGKEKAATQVDSVARTIHEIAGNLEEQAGPQVAQYVHRAADMLDDVAEALRTKSVDELLDEARNLARRNPTVAIGAAFAVGFALSRFLKATAPEHDMVSGAYGSSAADRARPPVVGNGSGTGHATYNA